LTIWNSDVLFDQQTYVSALWCQEGLWLWL